MSCLMPDWTCDAGCDVPWTDELTTGHESHFQALLVPVLCPHRCSHHLQRWGAVPIPENLLGQQQSYL